MGWAEGIKRRGTQSVFNQAWAKARRLRTAIEKAAQGLFQELVTVGIDVEDAPDLGDYTPTWAPLSDSWEARKGFDEFYFHKGGLEAALRGKNAQALLGRPQVFLEWDGKSIKVHAGKAPKKYKDALPSVFYVRAVPFPRLGNVTGNVGAVSLIAEPGSLIYHKLTGPHGLDQRPLVGPFLQWWIHVRMKNIMRGKT